ncbi:hypothetical protein PAESOLCIP111_03021 [Paenibacillus solanacearum]|uniref:Uncharacterized protein n=1 Tax=Paenibacillus solanacearum TaxID=2048548 RepID=A0A916K4E7_9BACL|nr:hypothetical protein [Paenibacillus solanacearum]CAG7628458.1 hypothetical protein PAESOLCIP111_03021 [Paenibacillus solanacearum]
MGKLVVACLLTVFLGGVVIYLSANKIAPAISLKGTNLNTSLTTATVNQTDGTISTAAP